MSAGRRGGSAFYLSVFLTLTLVASLFVLVPSQASAQESTSEPAPAEATISTDKFDYPPNTVVTFTGSGWWPGETVQIEISRSDGAPGTVLYALADDLGQIRNSNLSTTTNDLDVAFGVVASGGASGLVATTSFIDSHGISLSPTQFLQQNAPVSLNIFGPYSGGGFCGVGCSFSFNSFGHQAFISGPSLPSTALGINSLNSTTMNVTIPAGIANMPGTYNVVVNMSRSFSTTIFHCHFPSGCHSHFTPSFEPAHDSAPAVLTILQANQAPTVDAGGPYNVNEGSSVLVTASGSDPDGEPLTYNWDLNNDGTFETPGNPVTFSAATIDGLASRTINVRVVDVGGLSDTDSATVNITNVAPTPDAGGPYNVNEDSSVALSGSATDPAPADVLTYSWDLDNNGTFETAGQNPTFSAAGLDGPSAHTVVLQVCDDDGGCATDSATVNVTNDAPTVVLTGPATANEGDVKSYSYSWTDPGTDDTFPAAGNSVSCGPSGSVSNAEFTPATKSGTFDCTFSDDSGAGTFAVTATVTDDDGGSDSDTINVDVDNVAPTVGTITAPADPVPVGDAVGISAPFRDPGTADTHSCAIDWGDSSTTDSSGVVTEPSSPGSCAKSHAYEIPGVYTITMVVSDDDGGSDTAIHQYVVVYDPAAGFVTGGGWFNSPSGAYTPGDPNDPDLTGKATFGFVSKYKKGATVPQGNTEFQFHAAKLNFKSTSYEWLVIAGPKAQYKGWGTINGIGSYRFILTANDGQVNGGGGTDKLRIKIWDPLTDEVIYDNQVAAGDDYADATNGIANGSIVIHK
ncbi:MAG: PKD domain-containing protein [Actinomycetota bacterium]